MEEGKEQKERKHKIILYKKTEALKNEDHPGVRVLNEVIFTEPIAWQIFKKVVSSSC